LTKYKNLDPELRARKRESWNQPVLWPLYLGLALAVLILIPGIVTFMRERQ